MGEHRHTGRDLKTPETGLEAMRETRDMEMGRQLEAFGEPDHGPEYWRDVRLRVAEASQEGRMHSFGRRLLAAFARRRVRLALAAAALAAAAAVVVLVGLPGTPGPQAVSAAQVLDKALTTYSSVRTWRADAYEKFYDEGVWKKWHAYVTRRVHIVRAADGSSREMYSPVMAGSHRLMDRSIEVYDATTERGVGYDGSEGTWGVETNGPLGPPDAGTVPMVDIGLAIRALAASDTLRLDETVVDGRPAWTVTCTKSEMAGLPPSGEDWPVYTITVDKQTWLLLGVQIEQAGRVTYSVTWRNVRVNESLPEDAFTVTPPPGVHIQSSAGGFRHVTLLEAAGTPGVTPLVPGFVPRGYELSGVAVAARAKLIVYINDETDETIWGQHVFALHYRRGFDAVTVSTRTLRNRDYTVDTDPCEEFDQAWSKRARTEAPITSGAFAGVTARILVASTTSAPHLWALKDGVLLTICGAATTDELLDMAESLQAYPASSPAAH
jgi:hypothetical protein